MIHAAASHPRSHQRDSDWSMPRDPNHSARTATTTSGECPLITPRAGVSERPCPPHPLLHERGPRLETVVIPVVLPRRCCSPRLPRPLRQSSTCPRRCCRPPLLLPAATDLLHRLLSTWRRNAEGQLTPLGTEAGTLPPRPPPPAMPPSQTH